MYRKMKTSQLKETGREDAIVDVVTPADIPAFYSRQALCVTVVLTITWHIKVMNFEWSLPQH